MLSLKSLHRRSWPGAICRRHFARVLVPFGSAHDLSLRAPEIAPHAADQRDEGLLFDADQPPLTQFADRGVSHLRRHPKLGYPDAASRPLEQLEQQLGARRSPWMLNRGEDHVAVVPFETLALDTQSEDEPFAEAIRKAAARDV